MSRREESFKRTVLVVEDDLSLRNSLRRQLSHGRTVLTAGTRDEAIKVLQGGAPIHALVLDLHLPDGRGTEVAAVAARLRPQPGIVVVTGEGSTENAVDALRFGAVDFLVKPFAVEQLERAVARAERPASVPAMPAVRDEEDAESLPIEIWRARFAPSLLGAHPSLTEVLRVLQRIADADVSVLITGESGTGKELVAHALHAARSNARPFITVNCAAIPENLLESELFGHVRGAFTNADSDRIGRFVAAHGGTLFLDEIGELPLGLQAKILRVLQEKVVTPIGSTVARKVDVRVVAATNRDLAEMSAKGTFRLDLYYRLSVVPVSLPPLRARRSDIPELVRHFVARASRRDGRAVDRVDPGVMDRLCADEWPGNVRQLENVIARMVLLSRGEVLTTADLPPEMRDGARAGGSPLDPVLPLEGLDLKATLERIENALIDQALARTGGNKNRAAALLHLNRTTLVEKLRKRES